MKRLIPALSLILAAPLLASWAAPTATAAAPGPSERVAVSAKPSGECRKRVLNPSRTVDSPRFARCVVKGMQRGRTATVTTRHTQGTSSTAVSRFTTRTDASVKYSDGARLVMIDGKGWYKPAGKGWVRPGTGSEDQLIARAIVALWNASSSPAAYRKSLRTSSTGWKASGKVRKLNGVRAREYVGTVRMGGVSFSHYAVWVDQLDRPVRIASTGSMSGVTVTSRQDFKRWGKPVSIKPPTRN